MAEQDKKQAEAALKMYEEAVREARGRTWNVIPAGGGALWVLAMTDIPLVTCTFKDPADGPDAPKRVPVIRKNATFLVNGDALEAGVEGSDRLLVLHQTQLDPEALKKAERLKEGEHLTIGKLETKTYQIKTPDGETITPRYTEFVLCATYEYAKQMEDEELQEVICNLPAPPELETAEPSEQADGEQTDGEQADGEQSEIAYRQIEWALNKPIKTISTTDKITQALIKESDPYAAGGTFIYFDKDKKRNVYIDVHEFLNAEGNGKMGLSAYDLYAVLGAVSQLGEEAMRSDGSFTTRQVAQRIYGTDFPKKEQLEEVRASIERMMFKCEFNWEAAGWTTPEGEPIVEGKWKGFFLPIEGAQVRLKNGGIKEGWRLLNTPPIWAMLGLSNRFVSWKATTARKLPKATDKEHVAAKYIIMSRIKTMKARPGSHDMRYDKLAELAGIPYATEDKKKRQTFRLFVGKVLDALAEAGEIASWKTNRKGREVVSVTIKLPRKKSLPK